MLWSELVYTYQSNSELNRSFLGATLLPKKSSFSLEESADQEEDLPGSAQLPSGLVTVKEEDSPRSMISSDLATPRSQNTPRRQKSLRQVASCNIMQAPHSFFLFSMNCISSGRLSAQ